MRKLLRDVARDQALMLQLTPEAMEVFNAPVLQRPGIRYGAVVGQAAPPTLHATLQAGIDPAAQVTHALYSGLYRLIEAVPVRWAAATHLGPGTRAATHVRGAAVARRQ